MKMMIVYLHGSYTPMKKLSIMSFINLFFIFCVGALMGQEPFLELRPFEPPSFEQYPSSSHVDHHHPYSNGTDNLFLRFDGSEFVNDVIYPDCIYGASCYDGHAGTDYFMPFNTPILAPADGYVLWASFSAPADPCPGGITPNGDQGTIILAHGNNYYTVYLHMTPPLSVSVGNNVETGDTLGFAGNTGCAINTHLHFEVRRGNWFFDSVEPYAVDPFGWWGDYLDPIEEFRNNRSDWLWVSDSLIDDGDNGFQRFQGPDWVYLNQGFNNDSWTSPTTTDEEESRHCAIWVPSVDVAGEYNIEAFIPGGVDGTTGAIYELYEKNEDGVSTKSNIVVDQSTAPGEFIFIETVILTEGENLAVMLRDLVTSDASGSSVVFDAIKITPNFTSEIRAQEPVFHNPEEISVSSAFPNPFNSNIVIRYELLNEASVKINLVDIFGRDVLYEVVAGKPPGRHSFSWNGRNKFGLDCPSGVYFFSISTGDVSQSKKIIYLK